MENQLQALLGKQYLITAYIEPRMQIVNYIMNGYDNNVPVLMTNRFLHFTAHIYYRSIIVDLCSLFSKNKKTHKNNFHQIINNGSLSGLLKPEAIEIVKEWLQKHDNVIDTIIGIRNKQIAHYDFNESESISHDFQNLNNVNILFELAQRIIMKTGTSYLDEGCSTGYSFGRKSHNLTSLEKLIQQ